MDFWWSWDLRVLGSILMLTNVDLTRAPGPNLGSCYLTRVPGPY